MKTPEFKIAFVPIDNRPITYLLTEQITDIDNNLKLFMPKRELLGGLIKPSNINAVLDWLQNLETVNLIVLSLDTIAYGGLVSSMQHQALCAFQTIILMKKKKNIGINGAKEFFHILITSINQGF